MPLAWMLFLGSSIMLMGKMLSCIAQRSAKSAPRHVARQSLKQRNNNSTRALWKH